MRVLNIITECFPTKITAIRCGCQSDYSWSAVLLLLILSSGRTKTIKKKSTKKKETPVNRLLVTDQTEKRTWLSNVKIFFLRHLPPGNSGRSVLPKRKKKKRLDALLLERTGEDHSLDIGARKLSRDQYSHASLIGAAGTVSDKLAVDQPVPPLKRLSFSAVTLLLPRCNHSITILSASLFYWWF